MNQKDTQAVRLAPRFSAENKDNISETYANVMHPGHSQLLVAAANMRRLANTRRSLMVR